MNFSAISNGSVFGRALRLPLRLIPETAVLPVLQGPLRGKKWIAGSSSHGCWLGSYEYQKQRRFQSSVRPGDVVFDVGANVGFYSLLASVLVGSQGKVYAFEPLPQNLRFLIRHLELNRVGNVSAFETAISDRSGVARFQEARNNSMGKLAESGSLTVNTTTIDELVACGECAPPDLLKIDVEGAELAVLQGARQTLATRRPTLFLATHGQEIHGECCRLLKSLGCTLDSIGEDEVFARWRTGEL